MRTTQLLYRAWISKNREPQADYVDSDAIESMIENSECDVAVALEVIDGFPTVGKVFKCPDDASFYGSKFHQDAKEAAQELLA